MAFNSIGYKTYVVFAVINAAIVPCVWFFFPETAYRSLEEMDEIFHKTTNPFDVVKIAHEMPHRYDKHGDLLIAYEQTDEYRQVGERRRSSVARAGSLTGTGGLSATEHRNDIKDEEKGVTEHRE